MDNRDWNKYHMIIRRTVLIILSIFIFGTFLYSDFALVEGCRNTDIYEVYIEKTDYYGPSSSSYDDDYDIYRRIDIAKYPSLKSLKYFEIINPIIFFINLVSYSFYFALFYNERAYVENCGKKYRIIKMIISLIFLVFVIVSEIFLNQTLDEYKEMLNLNINDDDDCSKGIKFDISYGFCLLGYYFVELGLILIETLLYFYIHRPR